MNVLVTGATGFIGRHLVIALLKKGHKVYAITRDIKKEEVLKKVGVLVINADITDKKSLDKLLEYNIDAAFHLAGVLGNYNVKKDVYWKVNVEGTRNLFIVLAKNKTRLIHISSTLVIGKIGKYPANEQTRVRPSNLYERTKYEGEKIALGFLHVGMPVTIIRPEFVYGPHDIHLLSLFRVVRDKKFIFIGSGKNYVQPTYIDDLIEGLLLCLERNETIGRVYILAGAKYVTIKEFIGEIANYFNIKPPKLHLPPLFAKLLAVCFEILAKFWPFDPPLTRSRVKFFTQNHFFDISRAKRDIGYKPKVSLAEGIKNTIDWYKENKFI